MHLKKEVIKVTYNVKESVEAEPYPILIECSDGSSYNADHVICSVSLGVLKRQHKSIFQPPLPQTKIDTIEGMGFGVVGKIILEFEQPFWPVDWPGFTLLWKVDDLKGIRKQNGNEWLEYITGIFTINRQRNLLLVWINGAGAREMEQLPESQVRDGVTSVLKKFLKDWSIPDPIRMKRFDYRKSAELVSQNKINFQIELVFQPTFPWFILTLFHQRRFTECNNCKSSRTHQ